MEITHHPSPNFGPRRGVSQPSVVVLHYTAMHSAAAALTRLCDPQAEVSAHYLIARTGEIFGLVAEDKRAWHAGAGAWGTLEDINSHSLGIELDNAGDHPFAEAQMLALTALLEDIARRHGIAPERVIGHSDMAPLRKRDPGPRFDWRRLARAGLSIWPGPVQPVAADQTRFQSAAAVFGYRGDPAGHLDAMRQRFRPFARGRALDGWDVALMEDLAQRHPFVDLTASAD